MPDYRKGLPREDCDVRSIMDLRLEEMATEFRSLSENVKRLDSSGNGEIAAPIRERMTALTHGIANVTAANIGELTLKATIALEWLERCDLSATICASLCRDVILMFPPDP
jgi:hypothetical protein